MCVPHVRVPSGCGRLLQPGCALEQDVRQGEVRGCQHCEVASSGAITGEDHPCRAVLLLVLTRGHQLLPEIAQGRSEATAGVHQPHRQS
eukprot:g17391.t1